MKIPFSEETVKAAWNRSEGKCECESASCEHPGRHNKELRWESQGKDYSDYGWEAHHFNANGGNYPSNCGIFCIECHKNTRSYGE